MSNHPNELGAGHSFSDPAASVSSEKRESARRQLDAILCDPLFKHSKRCSDFLRFAVLRALDDSTEAIKERTLGTELFGRQPDYDTNLDPVVRVTAAEVRKRLHQYYQRYGRESEVRIEFPRGSYVPEFHVPENGSFELASVNGKESQAESPHPRRTKKWLVSGLVAAPYIALCIFLLGTTRQSTLDRFWAPIASKNAVVTICVPARNIFSDPAAPKDPDGIALLNRENVGAGRPSRVTLSDAIAFSTLSGALRSQGASFQIRESNDATLSDLRTGPIVLVGAFSNRWTQQLQSGRFGFAHDGAVHYVTDNQNPSSRAWSIEDGNADSSVDYGLISRVLNPETGKYLVTVAGIHGFGTEGAAECAASTECLAMAAKLAPGDWKRANIQIVIQTTVIEKSPGMPKVVSAYLWQ